MTIKREEKFKEWSAARQFYSNFVGWGYYVVYNANEDGTFTVTVYE